MIVTLTLNPSIDRSIALAGRLVRGEVQRAAAAIDEPGGKGVNVARVVEAGGRPSVAVIPCAPDDPFLDLVRHTGLVYRAVPVEGATRVNLTLSEPDGTTTKINAPGVALSAADQQALTSEVASEARRARWAVLSGSLPPGTPADTYVALTEALAGCGCLVAIDTSGAPLAALLAAAPRIRPDLIKPNGEELAEVTGDDPDRLDSDPLAAARAAVRLIARGPRKVLVTMGSSGAVLVTSNGAWHATPPPIAPVSTVGAGDSSLAGYLLADLDGAGPAECLARAVAYGSAAAAMPGTKAPAPTDIHPEDANVVPLAL